MSNYQTVNASASPEVQMNENFESIEHAFIYGKRQPDTTGLTWAYYGGRWGGTLIAEGTLALTDACENYVSVLRSSGAISVEATPGSPTPSPTNWNDTANYARVYKITCAAGAVSAVEDHRAGPYGVYGGSAAGTPVENEVPTGTINGANAAFTLAHAPIAGSTKLYLNGVRQQLSSGSPTAGQYTLSGSTITYEIPAIPQSGDTHVIDYRY